MSLGWPEIVLIVAAVLLIFGPTRLPQLAKAVGQSIQSFKSGVRSPDAPKRGTTDDAADGPSAAGGTA